MNIFFNDYITQVIFDEWVGFVNTKNNPTLNGLFSMKRIWKKKSYRNNNLIKSIDDRWIWKCILLDLIPQKICRSAEFPSVEKKSMYCCISFISQKTNSLIEKNLRDIISINHPHFNFETFFHEQLHG